jgi:hypothetical protein
MISSRNSILAESPYAPLPPVLAEAFLRQSEACDALGSPFTAQLCRLIATNGLPHGAVHQRLAHWSGDVSSKGDSVPLRMAGALHRLALDGLALADLYPPRRMAPDAGEVYAALPDVFAAFAPQISALLNSPPQTNEVRRSSIIMAGLLAVRQHTALPLALLELGASAGLNLLPDHFAIMLDGQVFGDPASTVALEPEWRGAPLAAGNGVTIASRAGCDLAPVSLDTPDDVIRLKSYIWADQHDRMQRLDAAMAIARQNRMQVQQADAADWLEAELARPAAGQCRVVFHTIALQYMPPHTRNRIELALEQAGATASSGNPLAHLSFEADSHGPGAPLTLRVWTGKHSGPHTQMLGRADFHGRWISAD